jgi:porphobilinogen synthase
VRETHLAPDDLVWPLFAVPGERVRKPVKSMPGVFNLSVDELVAEAQAGFEAGVRSVILFGIPETKDAVGTSGFAHRLTFSPLAISAQGRPHTRIGMST